MAKLGTITEDIHNHPGYSNWDPSGFDSHWHNGSPPTWDSNGLPVGDRAGATNPRTNYYLYNGSLKQTSIAEKWGTTGGYVKYTSTTAEYTGTKK